MRWKQIELSSLSSLVQLCWHNLNRSDNFHYFIHCSISTGGPLSEIEKGSEKQNEDFFTSSIGWKFQWSLEERNRKVRSALPRQSYIYSRSVLASRPIIDYIWWRYKINMKAKLLKMSLNFIFCVKNVSKFSKVSKNGSKISILLILDGNC